jgi:hypothetical protein
MSNVRPPLCYECDDTPDLAELMPSYPVAKRFACGDSYATIEFQPASVECAGCGHEDATEYAFRVLCNGVVIRDDIKTIQEATNFVRDTFRVTGSW